MEISGDKAYDYTQDELLKQVNLLEIHLKQSKIDPDFCNDCVNKHLFSIRGLIDEQEGFANNENERENLEEMGEFFTELQKKKDFKENGPDYANEVRKYRKMLIYGKKDCPSCDRKQKNLNSKSDYDDSDTLFNERGESKMAGKKDMMEIGVINAASFVGAGAVYAGRKMDASALKKAQETTPGTLGLSWKKKPSTYIGLGGGLGLQLVGLFAVKDGIIRTALVVAGSYLLATSVISIINQAQGEGLTPIEYRPAGMRRMAGPVRMSVGGVMPQPYGLVQID